MNPELGERLLRPLRFAARRNFSNLSKVKGLQVSVGAGLEQAAASLDPAVHAEACGLVAGLDAAPDADKRRRIERLMSLFGEPPVASVPPVSPPSPRTPEPAPEGPTPARLSLAAPKATVARTKKRVPMAEALPGTPLSAVVGVGPKTAERMGKRGLETVQDALFFVPKSYEDRSTFRPIGQLQAGDRVQVRAEVRVARVRPAGRGKRIFELVVADDTGTLNCRFFRFYQSQMEGRYPLGTEVIVCGLVTKWGQMCQMVHPEVEIVGEGSGPEGIIGVYADVEAVPVKKLRAILTGLAMSAGPRVQDPLPLALIRKYNLPSLCQAVVQAHLPKPEDLLDGAEQISPGLRMRQRLVFDELLFFQLALAQMRSEREQQDGLTHQPEKSWPDIASELLPFALTGAQSRVLEQISADLAQPIPMHRLLQGDVGSGKTAVAFTAMAIVHVCGRQSALLAPTEILAEQHFAAAQKLMGPMGIRVALLTGSTKASERRWLLSQLRAGALDMLIGTHALLEPAIVFKDLGLAIVDEQHRFGVQQRALLLAKREGAPPDMLVMTATPIPRTLALTAYGDLRVSIIDELPPGRSPTETKIFRAVNRDRALEGLRAELTVGRQAYVVFPLIDASEKLEAKAASEEFKGLQEALPDYKVALLHGRMSSDEKAEVMGAFGRGEIQVLVSTTVIEVGIDVANATVMMIENAERFGLSQLHQLRGRVGRGRHQGRCFLIAGNDSARAMERLQVLEASHDGFFVAERDLEIRGPGEMLGTRQSGLPDLVLADLVRDAAVLEQAKDEAFALVQQDPHLEMAEHRDMKAELQRRFAGRLELGTVG